MQRITVFHLLRHYLRRRPFNSSTEVRVTYQCTQRCRQCAIPYKNSHTMTLDEFRHVMRELKAYGAYVGFISGGEATLVPELPDMLREAARTFRYAATLVTGLINREDIIETAARTCLEAGMHIQTSFDGIGAVGDELRGVTNFSERVTDAMRHIAAMRASLQAHARRRSLLYANIVISNRNIEQIPDLIQQVRALGWKATIGLYHHLTASTQYRDDLEVKPDARMEAIIRHLRGNPDIMNLESFIEGILPYLRNPALNWCPFVRSRFLSTRTTIMENGDVHLCHGEPIGNIFREHLTSIFSGSAYWQRLEAYQACRGCWTTCYTQRYLLVRPKSPGELIRNIRKLKNARKVYF